jgi:hypothetical protein
MGCNPEPGAFSCFVQGSKLNSPGEVTGLIVLLPPYLENFGKR